MIYRFSTGDIMEVKAEDIFGILYLINKAASWFTGKTRLQKMVLIAQLDKEIAYPFTFKYIRYHYGPYSFDLQDLLNRLQYFGLLEERKVISGGYVGSQFRLTKEGTTYLRDLEQRMPAKLKTKIDFLWDSLKYYSTPTLITQAKTLFKW